MASTELLEFLNCIKHQKIRLHILQYVVFSDVAFLKTLIVCQCSFHMLACRSCLEFSSNFIFRERCFSYDSDHSWLPPPCSPAKSPATKATYRLSLTRKRQLHQTCSCHLHYLPDCRTGNQNTSSRPVAVCLCFSHSTPFLYHYPVGVRGHFCFDK